jgi:Macrocin-O-methyltransferase (TylF)
MRLRRRAANFFLKGCGVRNLYGTRLKKFIEAILVEIDLQHLRDAYPCQSFDDRAKMHKYVQDLCDGGPVDYLELGVFKGESIGEWVSLNKHQDSRFFGFDSFQGLPEHWRKGQDKGHFNVGGAVPRIDDPRVQFIKGWFDATIPPFVREFSVKNRLVVHLDADLYSSTMLALIHLGPFMSAGTLLIFDEFYDREHEFKAFMDWQRIYRKNFRIIAQMDDYGKICAELQ